MLAKNYQSSNIDAYTYIRMLHTCTLLCLWTCVCVYMCVSSAALQSFFCMSTFVYIEWKRLGFLLLQLYEITLIQTSKNATIYSLLHCSIYKYHHPTLPCTFIVICVRCVFHDKAWLAIWVVVNTHNYVCCWQPYVCRCSIVMTDSLNTATVSIILYIHMYMKCIHVHVHVQNCACMCTLIVSTT